jgi:phosphate starvation-inducible PhoH-like protein
MPRRNKNVQPQRSKQQPRRNARPGNKDNYKGPYSDVPAQEFYEEVPKAVQKVEPLQALTETQGQYIAAIKSKTIVFGVGPAGTGKSFVALSLACEWFMNKDIEKIVLTRPMVETGAKVGALPGLLEEKYAPYVAPLFSILERRLGKSQAEYFLKRKRIEAMPLEFMRGATFDNCVLILDEAQNTTKEQMKMFLTRIGENCLAIVNGDIDQTDIRGVSGLEDAVKRFYGVPDVEIVEFEEEDIVRSGIVREVIKAYRH